MIRRFIVTCTLFLPLFIACSPEPATYAVTYNGNGNLEGTVPVDAARYGMGSPSRS